MIVLFPRWDMLISWRVYATDPTYFLIIKGTRFHSIEVVSLNSQSTFLGHLDSIAGVGELYDPEKKGFYTLQAMGFYTR